MRLSSSLSGKPNGESDPPAVGLVYFDRPELFAGGVRILKGGGVRA